MSVSSCLAPAPRRHRQRLKLARVPGPRRNKPRCERAVDIHRGSQCGEYRGGRSVCVAAVFVKRTRRAGGSLRTSAGTEMSDMSSHFTRKAFSLSSSPLERIERDYRRAEEEEEEEEEESQRRWGGWSQRPSCLGPRHEQSFLLAQKPVEFGEGHRAGLGRRASEAAEEGLTLVHFSAQLERFLWDRGCA
jgi:hypothetical protein